MARNVMFVEIHKIHLGSGYFMVSANKADGRFNSFEWAWDKAVSPGRQKTELCSGPGNGGDHSGHHPLWLVSSVGCWVREIPWNGWNAVMWKAQGAMDCCKCLREQDFTDPWLSFIRVILAAITNRPQSVQWLKDSGNFSFTHIAFKVVVPSLWAAFLHVVTQDPRFIAPCHL